MCDISVIIVNYNVEFFLRQCIESVFAASHQLDVEIIVVDNNSVDNSLGMLERNFPTVTVIANTDNVGFSTANNQGIEIATGKYTLLLNPDTLIQEDTLTACIDYAELHDNIGAIGVKLVDGSGNFLPESKRGFPTVSAAFFKVTGIYKLFKHSSKINAYYAGGVGEDEIGQVDVLCGAFMFMPTEVLRSVGMLDEDYFMYGEDIDLSYMIGKAGKQIVYLPTTSTIHYKGESTKKSSKSYNNAFYGAMQIFIKKHFKTSSSAVTLFFLKVAIMLVSLVAFVKQQVGSSIRILCDLGLSYGLGKVTTWLWASQYYQDPKYFANAPFELGLISLCVSLVILLFLVGHYDEDGKRKRFLPAVLALVTLTLVIYGILPEDYRFSRLLIFSYLMLGALITFLTRVIANRLSNKSKGYDIEDERSVILVGNEESIAELKPIIVGSNTQIQGVVYPSKDNEYDTSYYVGNTTKLHDLVNVLSVNEVIFCSKDISMKEILQIMTYLGSKLKYKIANTNNDNYLGSDSRHEPGTWYTTEIAYNINTASNKRLKRSFDIVSALFHIVASPYMLLRSSLTRTILSETFNVLLGKKTLIGYAPDATLPINKISVINISEEGRSRLQNQTEYNYCRYYSIWNDVNIWINAIIYG